MPSCLPSELDAIGEYIGEGVDPVLPVETILKTPTRPVAEVIAAPKGPLAPAAMAAVRTEDRAAAAALVDRPVRSREDEGT